jgi:PPOX class probable F420-dependent enzyme
MSREISPKLEQRLKQEKIAWLTTVRADGTPQPTPIWFLWQDGTFLIYSKPNARKIANIANHPTVAINLNSDEWGGSIAVFTGQASVDLDPEPADRVPAYLEKYREGIAQIEMTPESMAREYSAAIRVEPLRVREE